MIEVILNRILVKPEELKREHKVEGTNIRLAVAYDNEKQHEASRVEGFVVSVGSTAYTDLGCTTPPVKVGDHVVFAKYSGVFVTDPETGETLVVLNDSDVLCIVRQGDK